MRDRFISRLSREAYDNKNIMVLTGDLGFGVFDTFSAEKPDQFLNVGVAEQNMALVASGLALEGYKVFIYSIGNFTTFRCLEQIRNDIAYHDLDVTIVAVGAGFSYGQLGMSHFAVEDISIMRGIPGMQIYSPHSDNDLDRCMDDIINSNGPKYLRIDKLQIEAKHICSESYVSTGLVQFCDGQDAVVFGTGSILEEALIAEKLLKEKGINISVFGVSKLAPCDLKDILAKLSATRLIVTIEEHALAGGFGSMIVENLIDLMFPLPKIVRLGIDNSYPKVVGDQLYLRRYCNLCSGDLLKVILKNIQAV